MRATAEAAARHRAWSAPFLAIAIALFIIAGLGWYGLNSLTTGLCGSTEVLRVASPDGRHDAVLFEHNCAPQRTSPCMSPCYRQARNSAMTEAMRSPQSLVIRGHVQIGADHQSTLRGSLVTP